MTRTRRLPLLPALLALFAAAGCDSPAALDPDDLQGTWAIETVRGLPVPAVVQDDEFYRVTFLADTLRIGPDRTIRQTAVLRFLALMSTEGERTVRFESRYPYDLRMGVLLAGFNCPPNPAALCAGPSLMTGRVDGDRLTLDYAEGKRVYVRVPSSLR